MTINLVSQARNINQGKGTTIRTIKEVDRGTDQGV